MTLKDSLEEGLIDRLGFPPKNFALGMAVPVSKIFGEISNPEEVANLIIDKVIENMPLEIKSKGPAEFSAYFQSFGYNDQKKDMIKAAEEIQSAQK